MEHSLFSRFQGSWFGSILGDVMSEPQFKLLQRLPAWLEARNDLALKMIESPVSVGKLATIKPELSSYCSSELALLLLPLILFYIDDFSELRQIVTQKSQQQLNSSKLILHNAENIQDVLIWGKIVSLALKAKLKIDNLIESILLDRGIDRTLLMQQFKIVARAVKTGKTMTVVKEELSEANYGDRALALSFYCFAVAPEDFELSLNLAISDQHQSERVAALTGALSGAYNGFMSISPKNRLLFHQNPIYQPTIDIIAKFFNVWAGTYREVSKNSLLTLVAAPGTLQTRSLKIISQTE
jgi:hypothetical protein